LAEPIEIFIEIRNKITGRPIRAFQLKPAPLMTKKGMAFGKGVWTPLKKSEAERIIARYPEGRYKFVLIRTQWETWDEAVIPVQKATKMIREAGA